MSTSPPFINGSNGRGTNGRFAPGNPGGPGNPFVKRAAELRSVLHAAVTDDDLTAVMSKLVSLAKDGDIAAIKLLLDRTIGKPVEWDDDSANWQPPETLAQRLARLEQIRIKLGIERIPDDDDRGRIAAICGAALERQRLAEAGVEGGNI